MNTSRVKFLTISAVVLIIAGAGFLIFRQRGSSPAAVLPVSGIEELSDSAGEKGERKDERGIMGIKGNEKRERGERGEGGTISASSVPRPALSQTYSNAELGFSFNYPEGLNVSGFAEGEIGYTILAQKPGSRESFQIFISDFDEPGLITPERIRQDIPDMIIENPQDIILGSPTSDGSPTPPTSQKFEALIFFSKSESLGRTREVWFVKGGRLYQLTAYADLDNLIGPILETFIFR